MRTMWLRCGLVAASTTTSMSTTMGIESTGSGNPTCVRHVMYSTSSGRTSITTSRTITPANVGVQTINFGSVTPASTTNMTADIACYFPSTTNSNIHWIVNTF